jgi:Flp pilus assembly protein TadG
MYPPFVRNHRRNEKGSVGALFFCALLIVGLGLGAFALDFAHMLAVRGELKSATDAGALAGAHAYAKNDSDNADTHALAVAAQNRADGRAVSNDSPGTQVTVQSFPSIGGVDPDIVEVEGRMAVDHMLAPIFGRRTDTITVKSRAGAYWNIVKLADGQAFPVAVNPRHDPDGDKQPAKPVSQLRDGDPVTLIIRPSANPGRNAVWTSFHISSANTRTYDELLQMYLGRIPNDPTNGIPELEAGVTDIHLDNGVNRGTGVDSNYKADICQKPFVLFPVITDDNYNQLTRVTGFITVKVNHIKYIPDGLEFTGIMKRAIVRGWSGELPPTNEVSNLSPRAVKLLPVDGS